MSLTISELKTEIQAWGAKVEGEAKTWFANLESWATGEEAKLTAAITLLQGNGYTVTPPAKPATPAA
jgi:hypothetical protein